MSSSTQRRGVGPLAWTLAGILALWIVGLFFLPPRFWLEPFAYGEIETLSGPMEVPPEDGRAGRRSLSPIRLEEGSSAILTLRAAAGPGFSLQLKDRESGSVVRLQRFPPRTESTSLRVILDSRDLPAKLRLALWNRNRSAVSIEEVSRQPLGNGYRWTPVVYLLLGPLLLLLLAASSRHLWVSYLRPTEGADDAATVRSGDRLMMVLVFLLCFTVFRAAPVHQLLDSKFLSVVSHSVLHSGTVALPETFARSARARQIYTLRPVGDKTYHFFAAAPAVLNAPFVGLFELAGVAPMDGAGRYLGHNEQRILRFVAAILAATLCAVLFLIARVWVPPGWALGLTFAFAFGSQILSVMSRPFWSHVWATLLLSLAIWILVVPRWRERWVAYLARSTLLCWAYFCRPPLSLAIIGVTVYLLARRRRFLLPYLTTGAVWASLFAIYAYRTYGSLVPPYFLSSHLESGRLAGGLLLTSYPEALAGTLISPGRGLLVYVPLVGVILWTVLRRWRSLPDRALAVTALGVCLAHWQLVSLFRNWWGGQSFGPRLMSDLLPWLFLLAVLGAAALRSDLRQGRASWAPWKTAAIGLLVALSFFIHFRGAWVQETQRGAGIWNWRYPQFLAGLLERPEAAEPAGDSP